MKRITQNIKKLDLIATLIDLVYVLAALALLSYFFIILAEPEFITEVIDTTYNVLGITITSAQLNAGISLLIGYLIIFVPLLFSHVKRLRSKDIIEMDQWTYRTQFLYSFMSLFTLNPFSAVVRFIIASEPSPVTKLVLLNATDINQFSSDGATSCGQIYASHAPIALRMVIVMIVGLAIGIITLLRYLKSLHPSTCAAR